MDVFSCAVCGLVYVSVVTGRPPCFELCDDCEHTGKIKCYRCGAAPNMKNKIGRRFFCNRCIIKVQ